MKTKRFVIVGCLAAGALIVSPAFSKPAKKSAGHSSNVHRTVLRTTHVTPTHRYVQSKKSNKSGARYYAGTRYGGTRAYSGRQYGNAGYYSGTPYYGAKTYYGGTRYYGGGSYPYYSYSSSWPYSNWGYGASWGYYPYSYYGGYAGYPSGYYNNYYSYYAPTYGHNGSLVAAVQRRLGELGYYHGAVDGVIGPRTRRAIAAFESRNGLVIDARISRPLLARLGLA